MRIQISKIGYIYWLVIFGVPLCILWVLAAIGLFVSIVFIPFSIPAFKIAGVMLNPFDRLIQPNFEKHPFFNLLWAFFVGSSMASFHIIMSGLCYITVVGKKFAKTHFYLALLSLIPFGADF